MRAFLALLSGIRVVCNRFCALRSSALADQPVSAEHASDTNHIDGPARHISVGCRWVKYTGEQLLAHNHFGCGEGQYSSAQMNERQTRLSSTANN